MKRACKDCEFYQEETDTRDASCRRHAPTFVYAPPYEDDTIDGWPAVDPDDWCGEFQALAEEQAKKVEGT